MGVANELTIDEQRNRESRPVGDAEIDGRRRRRGIAREESDGNRDRQEQEPNRAASNIA
jgi:hypothetical protein